MVGLTGLPGGLCLVAVVEHLVADELGSAAGTAVAAVVVGENGVAHPLLLVAAGIPVGARHHAIAVVAIALEVQIPAPGFGGRLLHQDGQGSDQEQGGEEAFHGNALVMGGEAGGDRPVPHPLVPGLQG